MKLAIIVPAFNEASTIAEVVGRLRAVPLDKEIIVVDDGSTDGTTEVLTAIGDSALKLARHESNRGKGSAIRTGLNMVTADAVVIQDADLEYAPEQLPDLLKPIEEGRADAVYGSRFLGTMEGMRFSHYLANKILALTASLLFGRRVTDEATCYKMFKTDLLKSLPLESRRYEFCPEVTARILRRKVRFVEVPITYHARTIQQGKKIRIHDALSAMLALVKYRFASEI